MAKRKRLTPPLPGAVEAAPAPRGPLSAPPIAQVAGEAAATAALDTLSAQMATARAEGRLMEAVPLTQIDPFHLVRDRLVMEAEDMGTLMASLRSRGQQTPVELVRLSADPQSPRYGLVSGLRRFTALAQLHKETGDPAFGTIKAVVTDPQGAQSAYIAMVEENEIRVNLSFYERARIAQRAVASGVFEDTRAALRGLYGSAPRAKRSKIGSFIPLVDALDGALSFPTAISEKLGLALAKKLNETPNIGSKWRDRLLSTPRSSAEEEQQVLAECLSGAAAAVAPKAPKTAQEIAPGLTGSFAPSSRKIELHGADVDRGLYEDLVAWLKARQPDV